nr:cytochrome c oxidase assembly protein [Clavibacter michiganensis]
MIGALLTPHLAPHAHGAVPLEFIAMMFAGLAIIAYAGGMVASRRAGRPWPFHHGVLWVAGVVAATVSVVGPLAAVAHDSFVAHMWAHLLIGMLAPVLLVLAAPVTLALRTLDVVPARRLARLLKSRPVRFVAHPITATVLSAGGLWLIYLTPIFGSMQSNPLVHLLVHAHVLAAGYLFTTAVIGLDPRPHPATKWLTAAVLVLAVASHAVLAKYLYAHPPAGVAASEAREGAQLMYYLGGWIEAAVIVIFCAQWYRAAGRILGRAGARASDV